MCLLSCLQCSSYIASAPESCAKCNRDRRSSTYRSTNWPLFAVGDVMAWLLDFTYHYNCIVCTYLGVRCIARKVKFIISEYFVAASSQGYTLLSDYPSTYADIHYRRPPFLIIHPTTIVWAIPAKQRSSYGTATNANDKIFHNAFIV